MQLVATEQRLVSLHTPLLFLVLDLVVLFYVLEHSACIYVRSSHVRLGPAVVSREFQIPLGLWMAVSLAGCGCCKKSKCS